MSDSHQLRWQAVVQGYLNALFQDARTDREHRLAGSEAAFLSTGATESVRRKFEAAAQARVDRLGPPVAPSNWQVVDQSDGALLVEIANAEGDRNSEPIPFFPIRLRLRQATDGWLISGIYEPCPFCNLTDTGRPGKCYCDTTNINPTIAEVFPCPSCGGSGRCRRCIEEKSPGWRPAIRLRLPTVEDDT